MSKKRCAVRHASFCVLWLFGKNFRGSIAPLEESLGRSINDFRIIAIRLNGIASKNIRTAPMLAKTVPRFVFSSPRFVVSSPRFVVFSPRFVVFRIRLAFFCLRGLAHKKLLLSGETQNRKFFLKYIVKVLERK